MLCKNCGKELPIAGKFCPFCGAAVEQTGVNDETAVFTTLPDDMKDPVEPVRLTPARLTRLCGMKSSSFRWTTRLPIRWQTPIPISRI